MQTNSFTTTWGNMDVRFSDVDTPSYTITPQIGVDGTTGNTEFVTLTATRRAGQFANATLTLTVRPNGSISRSCQGGEQFCALVRTAGYTSGDHSDHYEPGS